MNLKRKIMKTQNILALLFLVFVFAACEKDEIQSPETSIESNQVLLTKSQETTPGNRYFATDTGPSQVEIFAGALQWTSFLTGRTLKDNALAHQEFANASTISGIFDLNALLDPNGSFPNFNQRFREVLLLYVAGRPDEENEPNRPIEGKSGN